MWIGMIDGYVKRGMGCGKIVCYCYRYFVFFGEGWVFFGFVFLSVFKSSVWLFLWNLGIDNNGWCFLVLICRVE